MGLVHGETLNRYYRPHDLTDCPLPPLPAWIVEIDTPESALCPYSGRPSTDLLQQMPRIFGFCNAFCLDKTIANSEAWPDFMALHGSYPPSCLRQEYLRKNESRGRHFHFSKNTQNAWRRHMSRR